MSVNGIGRPSKIRETEWESLIRQLLAAGWSSSAISMFLRARYQYNLDSSVVRRYAIQERDSIIEEFPELAADEQSRVITTGLIRADEIVDVVGETAALLRLQGERLKIGFTGEQKAGKLTAKLRFEVLVYGKLLKQYHELLQDWGVAPKAGVDVNVRMGLTVPVEPVGFGGPVIELFPEADRAEVIALARRVNEALP